MKDFLGAVAALVVVALVLVLVSYVPDGIMWPFGAP